MNDDSQGTSVASDTAKRADSEALSKTYAAFFNKFGLYHATVLQIGAAQGRLTEMFAGGLATRIHDYHVIDTAPDELTSIKTLADSLNFPASVVAGDQTALAKLPENHFNVVVSQSHWSTISLYDQYLYLRDLRRVVAVEGILMVNGVFLLGGQNDWGWNRFRRRVSQMEQNATGVYHEFTGTHATIEMALRLGWEVIAMTNQAFIMRFRHAKKDVMFDKWADVPANRKEVVFAPNLMAYLDKGKGKKRSIEFIPS